MHRLHSRQLSAAASAAVMLMQLGCSTPNAPGQGRGAAYTPVVDMQGVDRSLYSSDLAACRRLAEQADGTQQMAWGLALGAVVGTIIGSQAGLRGSNLDAVATAGAGSAMNTTANRSLALQERIMVNCMAGRGYRTLDAAGLVVAYQPQRPTTTQAGAQVGVGDIPAAGAVVAASLSAKPQLGQWSMVVERLPEARACNPAPVAQLSAKGAGTETYTVACASGDLLTVKCEFSNCRALR